MNNEQGEIKFIGLNNVRADKTCVITCTKKPIFFAISTISNEIQNVCERKKCSRIIEKVGCAFGSNVFSKNVT
jgi:hypothetical protein